jgi:hypothetical protein
MRSSLQLARSLSPHIASASTIGAAASRFCASATRLRSPPPAAHHEMLLRHSLGGVAQQHPRAAIDSGSRQHSISSCLPRRCGSGAAAARQQWQAAQQRRWLAVSPPAAATVPGGLCVCVCIGCWHAPGPGCGCGWRQDSASDALAGHDCSKSGLGSPHTHRHPTQCPP